MRSILVTLMANQAGAQGGPSPAAPRGWLPREVQWPKSGSITDRARAMSTLERFDQMMRAVPALARPDGFEILPQFAGGHFPLGSGGAPIRNGVMRYNYGLSVFVPSRAKAEGRVCISFVINDDAPSAAHRDSAGREFYIEGDRGTPIPGAAQVLGGFIEDGAERSGTSVLFTADGAQPWRQATREELIQALIFEAEGNRGERTAQFAKTPYQEWVEMAAQRKRDREATIAQARELQGVAGAQKLRERLEAVERDVTERLRAEDASVRERYADAQRLIEKGSADLRAALAAMTPAERRLPAIINNALLDAPAVGGYHLTTDTMPPAWRVLTTQYEFWRARRSPVEAASIRVTFELSGTCLQPQVQRAVRQAFSLMNWGAVRATLAPAR